MCLERCGPGTWNEFAIGSQNPTGRARAVAREESGSEPEELIACPVGLLNASRRTLGLRRRSLPSVIRWGSISMIHPILRPMRHRGGRSCQELGEVKCVDMVIPSKKRKEIGRRTFLTFACLLVIAVTACNSSSPEGRPPMQIVLLESFDSPRVYVADWLGHRLNPRLLTELPTSMRVVDATTSSGNNILAVVARRPPEDGGWKWEVYLLDPLTGRNEKVYEDERSWHEPHCHRPGKAILRFSLG